MRRSLAVLSILAVPWDGGRHLVREASLDEFPFHLRLDSVSRLHIWIEFGRPDSNQPIDAWKALA